MVAILAGAEDETLNRAVGLDESVLRMAALVRRVNIVKEKKRTAFTVQLKTAEKYTLISMKFTGPRVGRSGVLQSTRKLKWVRQQR
jgi:nucleoside-triphosphatase THEP1